MLFDNTEKAYSLKSNYDLKKALIIFKLISNKRSVNIGSRLVNLFNRLNLSVNFLFKETVFKQGVKRIHGFDSRASQAQFNIRSRALTAKTAPSMGYRPGITNL